MIILLDNSPDMIAAKSERFGMTFGQLRTPLSAYRPAGLVCGIDNGCFGGTLDANTWRRIISEHVNDPLLKFVAAPDVVCSARRTLEVFVRFQQELSRVPVALVLQNGIEDLDIPWHHISAVFVGGDDGFKDGPHAMHAARAARLLGKWVHVGRVNGVQRVRRWLGIADSVDGTGLSKFDDRLGEAVRIIKGEIDTSQPVFEFAVNQ